MSNRSNNEILEDIREASRRIEIYTADMTYGTFQIVVVELPDVALQIADIILRESE